MLLAVALAGLGCQDRPPSEAAAWNTGAAPSAPGAWTQTRRPTEIISWWTRTGGLDALDTLIAIHRRTHPEDIILNGSVPHSKLARRTIATRMGRGDPPDLFQANTGGDLMDWVMMNGTDARDARLLPLNDRIVNLAAFRAAVPPAVLAHSSQGSSVYGIPTNIERVNSLYINKKVFDRLQLTPPRTLDELRAVAEKLRAAGVTPLALGSRDHWPAVMLVFECVLVAREGGEVYQAYFEGRLSADDARVRDSLKAALALFRLVNPDHAQRDWVQAAELLFAGQAGMMVMGDWANLLFKSNDWKAGRDFLELPFPGTEGVMVFTSDTFALPVEARNKNGAARVLATMASIEGQEAMNRVKNQLPARLDALLPSEADHTLAEKRELAKKGALVLAISGMVPRRFGEDLGAAVGEMLSTQDIEPVLQTLRTRYVLLKP